MRIAVTVIIEMSDAQIAAYAEEYGIPQQPTGHHRAKDIVDDVRSQVLTGISGSTAFGDGAADVSIKR